VKQEKIYQAALLIAALLVQSAAIDATAATTQSKKNRKRAGDAATAAAGVKSSPEQATDETPVATPTPGKTNIREVAPAAAAPSPRTTDATNTQGNAPTATAAVRYSYEFNQPNFNIRRIVIEHDAAGRGQVSFARKDSEELFTDPLQIPPAALARLLAAWDALKFLDSDANYQDEKQFPHLGTMTLEMKQGARSRKAEFNWTHNEQAAALVKEYRGIGEQQLFIFDVTLARQYQPSDTVKIFKRLESLLGRGELSDTEPLIPVLRDLSTDERIPLMARNHAARLLKKIEK
jgi:type IV secretory pathway VirB10-like protein